jgi:hypothetical protein
LTNQNRGADVLKISVWKRFLQEKKFEKRCYNLFPSLNMREKGSYTHKTEGNYIFLNLYVYGQENGRQKFY